MPFLVIFSWLKCQQNRRHSRPKTEPFYILLQPNLNAFCCWNWSQFINKHRRNKLRILPKKNSQINHVFQQLLVAKFQILSITTCHRFWRDFVLVSNQMAFIANYLAPISYGFVGFNFQLFGTNFVGISSKFPWRCTRLLMWLKIGSKRPETHV